MLVLNAKYLYNNKDFFKAVIDAWGEAEKLPIEKAFELGILNTDELFQIIDF